MDSDIANYLSYDPLTGKICWIKNSGKHLLVGLEAGSITKKGYRRISFCRKDVMAHRLAWFLHYGEWPINQIDHINGDRDDNRIVNLRIVSSKQNNQNRKIHRDGRLLGCTYHEWRNKPWQARIRIGGTQKHLGYYYTELEAHGAYYVAAILGEEVNE